MLLIHFKLTHQNVVLQEAKKRLTSKRNPGLGGGVAAHGGSGEWKLENVFHLCIPAYGASESSRVVSHSLSGI